MVCAACFYAAVRPYRRNYLNNVDFLILALLEVLTFELLSATYHTPKTTFIYYCLATVLLLGAPHMILILYMCYVLVKNAGVTQCLKGKCKTLKSCMLATRHVTHETDVEAESDTATFLNHRLGFAARELQCALMVCACLLYTSPSPRD